MSKWSLWKYINVKCTITYKIHDYTLYVIQLPLNDVSFLSQPIMYDCILWAKTWATIFILLNAHVPIKAHPIMYTKITTDPSFWSTPCDTFELHCVPTSKPFDWPPMALKHVYRHMIQFRQNKCPWYITLISAHSLYLNEYGILWCVKSKRDKHNKNNTAFSTILINKSIIEQNK